MTTTIFGTPAWSGIGADHWDGQRRPDDMKLLSASSVTQSMAKPALERWMIDETAARVAENVHELADMGDPERIEQWVRNCRYLPEPGASMNASETGTALHAVLEHWAEGKALPPALKACLLRDAEMMAMANQLWGWLQRHRPEVVASEIVVYDPERGTAGRLDNIWRLEGLGNCLVDLKTTRKARTKAGNPKRPYADSHGIQLVTYAQAPYEATFPPRITGGDADGPRWYLLNPAELAACVPARTPDTAAILHLSPEDCRLFQVRLTDEAVATAAALMVVTGWIASGARRAINTQPWTGESE